MFKPFGSLVVTPLHTYKGVHILHLTVLNTFSMVLTWKFVHLSTAWQSYPLFS